MSRRRFRGYCPPLTRRVSSCRVTGVADYTTSLGPDSVISSVKLQHKLEEVARKVEVEFVPGPALEDVPDATPSPKTGIRRRRRRSTACRDDGYVTSLTASDEGISINHTMNPPREELALSVVGQARERPVLVRDEPALEADNDRHPRRPHDGDKQCPSPAATDIDSDNISSASHSLDVNDDCSDTAFFAFRSTYLIVHIAIMLADGLQGTHLYVLYEGYGYSVASLYCLGFVTGAITSPVTGPLVDKIGRKRSALLYCFLEVVINLLEQYPNFAGLILSRMVGGITTNLLFTVFESWLVTEHRRRGFAEDKLETVLRDSVVVSNLAAIASGYLAHILAERFGPVGPFEGAVTCTAVALVLVMVAWTENYGSEVPGVKSVRGYMADAIRTIVSDSKISRIGFIQGLTEGALQTFVFLWSPALRHFAAKAPSSVLGLDDHGQPAYGLIFGAFMACGVLGGLAAPLARKITTRLVSSSSSKKTDTNEEIIEIEGEGEIKPVAVEFLAALCYVVCAGLLIMPYLLPDDWEYSFSVSLGAFLIYEFMVGLYMPCEGVIRSLYMPTASMCSLMTMLRVIVNVAVALGVVSTNYIPFTTAFASVSILMIISAGLQLSLVSSGEWSSFFGQFGFVGRKVLQARSLSSATLDLMTSSLLDMPVMERLSSVSVASRRSLDEDFSEDDQVVPSDCS